MPSELIYTSVVAGLRPGTRGFCTVACTRGMSGQLISVLESLSGYRRLHSVVTETIAEKNPVIFSHLIVNVGGVYEHVLSRICDTVPDYSGRTNNLAHHLVISPDERRRSDPGFFICHDELFRDFWNQEPGYLDENRAFPLNQTPTTVCTCWENLTGDPGWGGVLAHTIQTKQPACIIYGNDQNIAPLFAESLALLPLSQRWEVSFSTFYMKTPPGISCQWKGVLRGSPEEGQARSMPQTVVIDLTKPLPALENETSFAAEMIVAAREGVVGSGDSFKRPLVIKRVPNMSPPEEELRSITLSTVSLANENGGNLPGNQPALDPVTKQKVDDLNDYYANLTNQSPARKKSGTLMGFFIFFLLIVVAVSAVLYLWREPLRRIVSPAEPQLSTLNSQLTSPAEHEAGPDIQESYHE